jgi:hypothetical protein
VVVRPESRSTWEKHVRLGVGRTDVGRKGSLERR